LLSSESNGDQLDTTSETFWANLPDAELLQRFRDRRDVDAFTMLVQRFSAGYGHCHALAQRS